MTLQEVFKFFSKFEPQINFEEATVLYNTVMKSPEGPVVEVGSACGGSTIVLIGAAEEIGKMVYSIDSYPEVFEGIAGFYTPGLMKRFKDTFKTNILNGPWKNIIQFNEDVVHCIDKIPNNLSLVFLDGFHEFSFIVNDFVLLFPRLLLGGYIFVHDVGWRLGQLSKTVETGNFHISEWIKGVSNAVVEDIGMDTMLCCRKG
jgi:hypothetical protein